MSRLPVAKTCKLYINGAFVRSESGRTWALENSDEEIVAHVARGSRKDMRDAVDAARAAAGGWASRTAYNRGQILYRMAEMLEARRAECVESVLATAPAPGRGSNGARTRTAAARREVDTAIDRLVCFAGWTDKLAHVLGAANPVAGPYYNFTVPEPTGVVAVLAPARPPLLGLVTLIAPALCAGNTVVAVADVRHPLPAVVLGEVCATSDVPAGVVNILTADRADVLGHLAAHREVNALGTANLDDEETAAIKDLAAQNITRVDARTYGDDDWYDPDIAESPWTIEPFVEMKTIWHPMAT